jgi:integrase
LGLGSYRYIGLAEARQKRDELRRLLISGVNPLEERRRMHRERKSKFASKMSFAECAKLYIESQRVAWKNPKHANQWVNTIETYANPVIGKMYVDEITTNLVVKIIEPIWIEKTETASRVRGRIESILNWATVRGLRTGENPARWRGHLENLLPKRTLIQKVNHHKAMHYALISNFFGRLNKESDISAKALKFLILTATRTNETLNATWSEINFDEKIWTIPAERMKAKKEHRIPLTDSAIELLRQIPKRDFMPYIFLNPTKNTPLSSNALMQKLKQLHEPFTVHGFRSTFRDWISEETSHSRDLAESALAHSLKDKVEAAYRRGDFFQKRRILMEDWEKFCYKNCHLVIGKLYAKS